MGLKDFNIEFNSWIKTQLEVQKNGLFGSLDKVWKDIKDSKWIGGKEEGWERFPYYLNGLVPLAYALNDEELINKANYYMNIIITAQREDGKIAPLDDTDSFNNDIWSLFLILKVITIYGELSNDERVNDVLLKALQYIDRSINGTTIINWAHARYFECLIPILYLKRRIKDKKTQAFLKELSIKLKSQGLDYKLASNLWTKPRDYWSYDTHGVNISMALKASELYKEVSGIDDGFSAKDMLNILDKYHGTAYGHFSSDECLAGKNPYHGAEVCGVVEAMYSYEILFELTNDTYYLDRLEALAFNALPATCLDDMWAHQYDQQVNQIASKPLEGKLMFKTNGCESNVFGLEPHFGCCTANFGQGWPLFSLSAFSKIKGGIQINIPLGAKIKDDDFELEIQSEYPFRKEIKLKSNKDIKVKLRIPSSVEVNKKYKIKDNFITLYLKENKERSIEFKYEPKLKDRDNGNYVLTYGPLLFSLPIDYRSETKEYVRNNVERKYPYCDYYFIPTSEYKYAFNSNEFKVIENEFVRPFDRENPPLLIESEFIKVDIRNKKGYEYVLSNKISKVLNKTKVIKMKPYGATYLRMTEMYKID